MSPSLAQLVDLVLAMEAMNSWGIDQINAWRDANFPGVDITRLRPQVMRKAAEAARAVKAESNFQ